MSYSFEPQDTPEMNAIWSRITSLRWLHVRPRCDTSHISHILSTQRGLTSLRLPVFSSNIQYCTNLLELTTPLPSINDYRYFPPSLTQLQLLLGNNDKWPFDNDNVIAINNHLPHLSSLKLFLDSPQCVQPEVLSSLSRWSSLTTLSLRAPATFSLKELIHNGSYLLATHLSPFPSLPLLIPTNQMNDRY
jgi:hypothetical protein